MTAQNNDKMLDVLEWFVTIEYYFSIVGVLAFPVPWSAFMIIVNVVCVAGLISIRGMINESTK